MPTFHEQVSALSNTANVLSQTPPAHVVHALAQTACILCDPTTPIGKKAIDTLPSSTGLTPAMVTWALETTLKTSTEASLQRLQQHIPSTLPHVQPMPAGLCAVILAGNLFTSAWRALIEPLLLRCPVLAKASSDDNVFPMLIKEALESVAPWLAEALTVTTFKGGDVTVESELFEISNVVSAYGNDQTIASIQKRLPVTTRFLPHGHGVGVAFISQESISNQHALETTCDALALDIAAYDQRGCMSPCGVWVEEGGAYNAHDVCQVLATRSLPAISRSLPRGTLDLDAAAAELQWRAVASVQGKLWRGDDFAICYEQSSSVLRSTPGYRNISVWPCHALETFIDTLTRFGTHLKTLGVGGEFTTRHHMAFRLPAPLTPRICPLGTMQTPPLDYCSDGSLPSLGYLRFVEIQ